MEKIKRENASNYWWYRLVSSFYILVVLSVCIASIFDLKDTPELDMFNSEYKVTCNTGELTFGSFSGKDIVYDANISYKKQKDTLYFSDKIDNTTAKIICLNPSNYLNPSDKGALAFSVYSNPNYYTQYDRIAKNYNIAVRESTAIYYPSKESYEENIGRWIVIFAVLLFGVPWLFKYIVFGKDNNRKPIKNDDWLNRL